MKKVVMVTVLAGLTVSACGSWRESRVNPRNWFGRAEPVQQEQLITDVEDPRALVPQITDLVIERTPDGAIVRATGLPPHAYLLQTRILRAKALLAHGRAITDAAYELGFVDQSHFHRHFKRIVGLTPGEFSKMIQDKSA